MRYHQDIPESELAGALREALQRRQAQARQAGQAVRAGETVACSEFQSFLAARKARELRSLQRCHYYAVSEKSRHAAPADSGAFVPATAARLEDDRNLSDGARRCARKIMELTYRGNRAGAGSTRQ